MFKAFISRIRQTINPINYAGKSGASIGDRCSIASSVSFGSEPYLIEIGNHVQITSGCRLITHDGGMWPLPEYRGGYLR